MNQETADRVFEILLDEVDRLNAKIDQLENELMLCKMTKSNSEVKNDNH